MATLLSQYLNKQEELQSQIAAGCLPLESLVVLQELNYRIDVLKTTQSLCQSAPVTTDVKAIGFHYQLVEAYIRFLISERKFGPRTDEAGIAKRGTAATALERIFADGRRRFASFQIANQNQYKNCISDMIQSVLPAWVQYRNTYINI